MNIILPVRIPDGDKSVIERAMKACRYKLDFTDLLNLAFEYWEMGGDVDYATGQDTALHDVLRAHLCHTLPSVVKAYAQLEELTALVVDAVLIFRNQFRNSLGALVEDLNEPIRMYLVRYMARDIIVRIEPQWKEAYHASF